MGKELRVNSWIPRSPRAVYVLNNVTALHLLHQGGRRRLSVYSTSYLVVRCRPTHLTWALTAISWRVIEREETCATFDSCNIRTRQGLKRHSARSLSEYAWTCPINNTGCFLKKQLLRRRRWALEQTVHRDSQEWLGLMFRLGVLVTAHT